MGFINQLITGGAPHCMDIGMEIGSINVEIWRSFYGRFWKQWEEFNYCLVKIHEHFEELALAIK